MGPEAGYTVTPAASRAIVRCHSFVSNYVSPMLIGSLGWALFMKGDHNKSGSSPMLTSSSSDIDIEKDTVAGVDKSDHKV